MRALLIVFLLLAVGLLAWLLTGGGDAPERGDRLVTAPEQGPATRTGTEPEAVEVAETGHFIEGVLLDEEKQPVADGRVSARGFDRVSWGWKETGPEVRSDREGKFRLRVENEFWVQVRAQHPGYQRAEDYASPQQEDPVELILKRGAAVTVIVQDPDLKPVAEAKVHLFLREDGESLDQVATDAQGRVLAGVVAPGKISVNVDHPKFAPVTKHQEVEGLEPIEVTIRLDRGGAIEGRVFSPGNEPVAQARVHPQHDQTRVATTDETGHYRLESIGTQAVRIVAEADGYGPGHFGKLLGWGRAVPVEVESGETVRGIDIALNAASFVRGRIVGQDKNGIEGIMVRVSGRGILNEGGQTPTDAEGRFEIGPLGLTQPSELNLDFRSAEYSVELPELEPLDPGDDLDLGDLTATRGSKVSGRVITEAGEPITGGGNVNAQLQYSHWAFPIRPDGTFEMVGLKAGEHEFVARAGEESELRSERIPVTVEGGKDLEGVELVVKPTFVVSGVVLTSTGNPRSGKRVLVVPEGTRQPVSWSETTILSTDSSGRFRRTDLLAGRYLVGLANWGENGWLIEEDPTPQLVDAGTTGVELRVEIRGGLVKGLVRSRANGQPVEKFEVDRYKYKLIFPDWEGRGNFEDPTGAFQLEVEQPGRWAFEISAPGFAPLRTAVTTVKTGEETDLGEIRLGQAGGVHGRVTDHKGHGVGWTRVHLLNAQLQTNWSPPYTKPSGRFEIKDVSPGTYTVFAVSPRHPLAMIRNVVVKEAVSTRVNVEFKGSAPLTIRVLDEKGQPLPGAELVWTFPELRPLNSKMAGSYEPPGYGSNTADDHGVIRKPYLPEGQVDLEIGAKGYRPQKRTVELTVGEPKEIEFRLDLEQ